ncbi:MAG: glycyl-radical enzyme activating protein [Oscillospiraceae bacterium]
MDITAKTTGTIINIQHFSVHDGPGIRTALFLKGCPLKCRWCANPESQSFFPEPAWSRSKCIGCKECVKKLGCISGRNGIEWDDDFNFGQSEVNSVCPGGALHIIGEKKTAAEVVDLCERDKAFFGADGGITVTGGEPLAQADFTAAIMEEAHRRGINTAIETCGCAPLENALKAAARADYYITDIKCINERLHIENTGASNKAVLRNLREVANAFPKKPILVRTPIIPGFNDNETELSATADFLKTIGSNVRWELLCYHRLGLPKYESLNREYPMGDAELDKERFEELHTAAKKFYYNVI